MRDLIEDYLNYIYLEKRLSDNTKESYSFDLDKFNKYLINNKKDFLNIKESTITEYLKYLKDNDNLSPKSIERHLTTIRNFYKYLVKTEIIKKDITLNIDNLKLSKTIPSVLSIDEVNELLNIELNTDFNYRTKAMLELMYGSGLRVSELVNLTLYSIDMYNNTVLISGKGNKERIVPISEYSKYYLELYLERRNNLIKRKNGLSNKLFLNNHGLPITRNGFNYLLNNILKEKKINKKVTPHTLRHSFATHLLNNGASLRTIQELLGHSDIVTTRIYTHVQNDKIKKEYEKYQIRSDNNEI